MPTTYVVLREDRGAQPTDDSGAATSFAIVQTSVEATNAEQARRKVAETMDEAEVGHGVTLIAVPARNWRTGRGTVKAEITRRIRSA